MVDVGVLEPLLLLPYLVPELLGDVIADLLEGPGLVHPPAAGDDLLQKRLGGAFPELHIHPRTHGVDAPVRLREVHLLAFVRDEVGDRMAGAVVYAVDVLPAGVGDLLHRLGHLDLRKDDAVLLYGGDLVHPAEYGVADGPQLGDVPRR